MTAPYQLVDAFLQMPQLSRRAEEQKMDPNIAKWFKPGDAVKFGFTLDDLVRAMEGGSHHFAADHGVHRPSVKPNFTASPSETRRCGEVRFTLDDSVRALRMPPRSRRE